MAIVAETKERRRAMSRLQRREALAGYLLIAPNLILFAMFVLFPVLFSLVLAFSKWNFLTGLEGLEFVGLRNFAQLPTDDWFTDSLKNNAVFSIGTVLPTLVLALLFAIILNRAVYMRSALRTMIFMPYISSTVAIAVVWLVIFHPTYGPVTSLLTSLGMADPPKWTASIKWALPTIMIVSMWAGVGYNAVIYLAGLQGIPQELYEAARIDGAGIWAQFRYVTLPLLSPTTFFLLITGVIGSFKVFAIIQVMTQGGPGTATTMLAYYIYRLGFVFYRMGYASAVAWILLIIVLIFTLILWRGQKRFTSFL